jgi:uncharacterized protein (DUF1015 family)
MASIKPFRAIRPNPLFADRLVQTTPQVQSVAGDPLIADGLPVLKVALEIGARKRPETPDGQARAYKDIEEELELLVAAGRLIPEQKPAIYVYEVVHKNYRQTGIWALTNLGDYIDGTIKTHELTFSDSVRRIKNYRRNTRLEGSPILMTYAPSVTINRIIAETIVKNNRTSLSNHEATHILWRIEDEATINELVAAFAEVKAVYLADGHHRLESSSLLAVEQRSKGEPAFDTIGSLYMASDQLRIQEFNRVVLPSERVDKTGLLKRIYEHFEIKGQNAPVQPRDCHTIGMYAAGEWFELKPYDVPRHSVAAAIDAAILQEQILSPLFGIADPVNDKRLKCIGGAGAMAEILAIIDENAEAVAFTLCPLSCDQLMAVADAGEILPPKSTWIDPKIPYGLLLYQHQMHW